MLPLLFEQAIRLLIEYLPSAAEHGKKPILFHDIRVGVYLYNQGYSDDLVLAGLLHDVLEWSKLGAEKLQEEFGDNVARLVSANTKNRAIKDSGERIRDLVKRCVEAGQDALIVKAADTLDSFQWYSKQNNQDELNYCLQNAEAIFNLKPDSFNDKIFEELKTWQQRKL